MSSSPPAPSAPADGGQTAPARSITGYIATVGGVEVHEVGEDNGLIACFFHLFDSGIEQRIQTGRFHFLVIPQLA